MARNTDANAAITSFSLEIQSSVGSYSYAGVYPFLRTRNELFRDHLKNVVDKYCDSDVNTWQKHNCCLLLHASDYLRGLTTVNCAFPVQFNATCRFECRRQYIDGHGAAAQFGRSPAVLQDMIYGTPCMAMIFTGSSVQIAPSSAVLSAANLSHSQGLDLLSRGAQ